MVSILLWLFLLFLVVSGKINASSNNPPFPLIPDSPESAGWIQQPFKTHWRHGPCPERPVSRVTWPADMKKAGQSLFIKACAASELNIGMNYIPVSGCSIGYIY